MKGTAKSWKDKLGFGFVKGEDGLDYFVHHTDIVGEGYKMLVVGEEVSFDPIDTEKGKRVKNLVRLNPPQRKRDEE